MIAQRIVLTLAFVLALLPAIASANPGTATSMPGAFDTSHNGDYYDAFVANLNPVGSALAYATFLGGSDIDYGRAIAVDGAGSAYVMGWTSSSDFPTTPGVFVVKLNPAGSGLDYATFLGGSGHDDGFAIAVDGTGSATVTGQTDSNDFPATPGTFDTSFNGYPFDAFVVRLDMSYTPNVLAPIKQPSAGAFVTSTVTLSGFAIDLASAAGTGIDRVHIYLDGPYGVGTIIGGATYGLDRPDGAAQYGTRFGPSGWELAWDTSGLAPSVHRLYLYAHRTTDDAWSLMPPHLAVVSGGHGLWLPLITRR